jgi:hypothetical protein
MASFVFAVGDMTGPHTLRVHKTVQKAKYENQNNRLSYGSQNTIDRLKQ